MAGVKKNVKREEAMLATAFKVKEAVKRYAGGKRRSGDGPKSTPFCMWPHPGDVAMQLQEGDDVIPNLLVFNLYEGKEYELNEIEPLQKHLEEFKKDFPLCGASPEFWRPGMHLDVIHPVDRQSTALVMAACFAEPNPLGAEHKPAEDTPPPAADAPPVFTPAPAVNPAVKRQRVSPPKPAPKQKGRGNFTPKEQR